MELREHIETTVGLTNISAWHNGDHWVAACQLHHSLMEVGHGVTVGAAILAALAELEAHRGEAPLSRWPELKQGAAIVAALAKEIPPEEIDFDGY